MGYPMTYHRVLLRSALYGNYDQAGDEYGFEYAKDRDLDSKRMLAGDLRRLEMDQRDEYHLGLYAKVASVTPEQVNAILTRFFLGDVYERAAEVK